MNRRPPLSAVPSAEPEALLRDPEQLAFSPTPQELERLLFTIESSLQINKRFQFFLWAQGVLQSFLPHQILIVVNGHLERGPLGVDVMASDSVSGSGQQEQQQAAQEVAGVLLREWNRNGRTPILSSVEAQRGSQEHPVTQAIWEMGLGNTLAHGAAEVHGSEGSFFIFGRMPAPPRRRSRELVSILLPHLHFAARRCVLDRDGDAAPADTDSHPVLPEVELSDREVQIMCGVRDGKTNAQIGLELDISPLTVKNHVQRVLRKLGVNNRAQAVARFVAMGSIGSGARRM